MVSSNSFNASYLHGSYNLDRSNANLKKSVTRLSSGYRINSSIDAPGELGVAGRLNSKVIHSSVLKRNLMNVSAFLEVQNSHLQKLAEIFNVSKADLLEDKPHINSAADTIAAHIDDDTPEAEREQIINFIENLKKARNDDKV